jgi:hypothetical protein
MDKEKFKVARFLPLSFTQANTLLVNQNLAKRGFISFDDAIPLVFITSNKSIVTWQGTQS